jgi:CheY-like chemotaxis protein
MSDENPRWLRRERFMSRGTGPPRPGQDRDPRPAVRARSIRPPHEQVAADVHVDDGRVRARLSSTAVPVGDEETLMTASCSGGILVTVRSSDGSVGFGTGTGCSSVEEAVMTDFRLSGGRGRSYLNLEDRPPRFPRRPDRPAEATIVACNEEASLLRLFAEIFEDEAYDLTPCRDGGHVLELVRAARPALAILDLRMGAVSARQVVDALRADAATASIPVLVCTTDPSQSDAAGAWMRESGCELLRMPFHIDHLLETAGRLTGQHRPMASPIVTQPALA